jgi:hypothetical protein
MRDGRQRPVRELFVDIFEQRRIFVRLIGHQVAPRRIDQRLVTPDGIGVMFAQLVHGLHHLIVIVELARAFGDVVEALGIGFGIRGFERAQIGIGGRDIAIEIVRRADSYARLLSLRTGQLLRQRLEFGPRARVFLVVQQPLAALDHQLRRGWQALRAQRVAQRD